MCDKESSTSTSTPSGLYMYCTRVDSMTIPIGRFKSQTKKTRKKEGKMNNTVRPNA